MIARDLEDLVDTWEVAETLRKKGGRDSVGVNSPDIVGLANL